MSGQLIFDENMKKFFELLYADARDTDACVQNIRQALPLIADQIRLGNAKLEMSAPKTKLRPEGENYASTLYQYEGGEAEKPYKMSFTIPDGGRVKIIVFARGEEAFREKEIQTIHYLFREIFFQYSRMLMQDLLVDVMHKDMATGVASLEGFMQMIGMKLAASTLQEYHGLFFNIHNFKYVNKIFPYEEGDVVLRKYAQTIQGMLKDGEIVARLGGDNFVALVENERIEMMADQIQELKLYHATQYKEKQFVLGATLGISALDHIEVVRDVMARVSLAYQAARQKGAGSRVYYSDEVQRQLMETQSIIANFLPALENREFVVYYQPKVTISDRSICGAEALVRWQHKDVLIPPMQFVPQLEREGSICRLDFYVLEEVCRFIKNRLDQGLPVVSVSVNFSRKHLEEDHLVEHIVETVDRYGVDHHYIEIELTESDDFQNYEIMSAVVNGLHEQGIRASIDDFGTGFSSLNMIKQVDLNVIKIDKSFIPLETDYPGKDKDMVMFANIVNMIRQLGKKTIAEGVEMEEQLQYLKDVGCDIVQGYVFDKPLVQEEFEQRLSNGRY